MSNVRFSFLTGDVNWRQYGGRFLSKKFNNGDWDYWMVMEVMNWNDVDSSAVNELGQYNVTLSVVSPQAAGKENIAKAMDACGLTEDSLEGRKGSMMQMVVECLHSYGIKTTLFEESGSNLTKLMKDARAEANKINMLFGFYMDKQQNAIGDSGWDFVAGNIGGALQRRASN